MAEYISKQRAKDLMGCCLASAKANYKAETSIFKKADLESTIKTIEAMIDVVGAVEASDVQPIKHGRWENEYLEDDDVWWADCTNCKNDSHSRFGRVSIYAYCPNCGAKMIKDGDAK